MALPRTQRYRITFEFVLRDRGDYEYIHNLLRGTIDELMKRLIGVAPDYLAIEKVEEPIEDTSTCVRCGESNKTCNCAQPDFENK